MVDYKSRKEPQAQIQQKHSGERQKFSRDAPAVKSNSSPECQEAKKHRFLRRGQFQAGKDKVWIKKNVRHRLRR